MRRKILFVSPGRGNRGLRSISFWRFPMMSIYRLAEITPPVWDIEIIDEDRASLNYENKYDLVAITAMTALAPRAYEIAGEFRKRGVTTIMGGIHASMIPEEAARYVDCVVTGEADGVGFWKSILDDFVSGILKYRYDGGIAQELAKPERYISKTFKSRPFSYFPYTYKLSLIQTQRGCPHSCLFCSVHKFSGRKIRSRPVEEIVREVQQEKEKHNFDYCFFLDDNIIAHKKRAIELFKALIPLKIKWLSQCDISIGDDDVIELAVQSGLTGILIGIESVNPEDFETGMVANKKALAQKHERNIKRLRSKGVTVLGAFILGLDGDTQAIADHTLSWANHHQLDLAQFTILTPLPGTKLFEDFDRDGRLITKDWSMYDTCQCVYEPMQPLTKEYLDWAIAYCYRNFHGSIGSVLKRLRGRGLRDFIMNFFINIEYSKFKQST